MICDEAVLQNLADAGCCDSLVSQYRSLSSQLLPERETSQRQESLLRNYRRELLDQLHENQRRLECLDYLLFQLRQEIKQEENKP